jgi:hypothetical protein
VRSIEAEDGWLMGLEGPIRPKVLLKLWLIIWQSQFQSQIHIVFCVILMITTPIPIISSLIKPLGFHEYSLPRSKTFADKNSQQIDHAIIL